MTSYAGDSDRGLLETNVSSRSIFRSRPACRRWGSFEQPSRRRVHGLLFPLGRRPDASAKRMVMLSIGLPVMAGRTTSYSQLYHEFPHVVFHVVERRAVLASLPDVRKGRGELVDGTADAGGVAASDDERALLAEGFPDELNEAFTRLQRGRLPLVVLDQLLHNRVRRANQDENRLARRRTERLRGLRDRRRACPWIRAQRRAAITPSEPSPSALSRTSTRSGIRLLSESASAPSFE